MLQDHYPDRLGMIFLTNMSSLAEFLVTLIKPLITKEVRQKIHILSHDPERRAIELNSFIESEFLPTWLGGTDNYLDRFDSASYYHQKRFSLMTDEESRQFLKTMPYHALS
jgi:CRAL/TRIO domain